MITANFNGNGKLELALEIYPPARHPTTPNVVSWAQRGAKTLRLLHKLNAHLDILATFDLETTLSRGTLHLQVVSSGIECLVAVSPRWQWRDKNASFIRNAKAVYLVRSIRHPDHNVWLVMSFTANADGDCFKMGEHYYDVLLKSIGGRLLSS